MINIKKYDLDMELKYYLKQPKYPTKSLETYISDPKFIKMIISYLKIGMVPNISLNNIDEILLYKIKNFNTLNEDEYYGFLFLYLFTNILDINIYKDYFKCLSIAYDTNIIYILLAYLKENSNRISKFYNIGSDIYLKEENKDIYIGNNTSSVEDVYHNLYGKTRKK